MRDKLILTDIYHKPTTLNIREPICEISEIICAKNEKPSLSIIIDTDGKAARYIGDGSPSLGLYPIDQYRISIDTQFSYDLHPVGYMHNNDDVRIADVIYGNTSLEYAGDELPYIICDFTLPKDIAAGCYPATIKLYVSKGLNDDTMVAEKTITLNVADATLPSLSEYTLYNDIWQHNSNIARTFRVGLWSDRHFELIDRVLDKLLPLGQKSATVIVSDCPWRGWGCYLMRENPANLFEYSCINTYLKDGKFTYDFSILDRLIHLYMSKGIDGDITLYGLIGIWKMPFFNTAPVDYPEQVKVRYTDMSDGTVKYMQSRADIISYITALFAHLHSIGVWNKVRIAADEPSSIEPFKENLDILQSICPDIKLKLAIDKPEVITSLGELTDTIAYSFPCTLGNYKKDVNINKKLYYVCNIPDRPNSQLDNSVTDNVAVIPLNHIFGLNGFLRWAFTCWPEKPLENICYNTGSLPAGDTCLVYPGADGNILESIRYRAYVKGVVIYELLAKIKTINSKKFDALLSQIIGNDPDYYMINKDIGISQNADDYRSLYSQILTYLSEV